MSEDQVLLAILGAIILASLIWHKLAGLIGLLICSWSIWVWSYEMHLMQTQDVESFGGLAIGFIGLLFILRYVVRRPDHDDSIYETGTGTYFPATGGFVKHYSSGLGRAATGVLMGGMIILFVISAFVSAMRFG